MNRNNTISVALCTYNGEKYLREQLNSIAMQSCLPDELVVCDDNSSDRSRFIIEEFSSSVSFPVRLYKNESNIGSTKNFERAISFCEGAIIVLCDQDDVWCRDKLELIRKVFDSSERVGAVFSNGNIVNEDLLPLGYTLWDRYCFGRNLKTKFLNGKAFEVLLKRHIVTGATMAFRSSFRNRILPISSLWVHDCWMAFLLSFISHVEFIDKELIDYRQHKDQQIGGIRNTMSEEIEIAKSKTNYSVEVQQYEAIIEHILKNKLGNHIAAEISNKITHLNNRQDIYRRNVVLRIAKAMNELMCGRYHRYSDGYKSFFKDIVCRIKM